MTELSHLISSPKSLLVFEAAARHGSFSRAAKDFNISQPSISRNIAQLEQDIGQPLFVRGAGGASLTEAGQFLFAAASEGLTRIAEAVAALRAQSDIQSPEIVLSLSNAFVTNWLVSRLAVLSDSFPEAVLRFDLVAGTRQKVAGEVDIATLIADPAPGAIVLAPEVIVPVCSPDYLSAHGRVAGPDAMSGENAVTGHRFLHLSDHPKSIWAPVLGKSAAGTGGIWHEFSDYAAIVQAAMDGSGIALGWLSVVAGSLRSGRLVPAWDGGWIETGRVVQLLSTRPGPMRPMAQDIARWICARMDEDIEAVADLGAGPRVRRRPQHNMWDGPGIR
ncbi:LysR family transcriptional regulator [Roseovarius sp. PS-C2]|uniref:LysR family transcriptional regulator n=1 Tax=Roseovarius sp. PS-C2 TaxID=2820814 RepID=UPI001C0D1B93|nr:LysR family transcriptional regulator [Roseovarius sp. PS-C2]MBU3262119.1 LysR family transcriptional regulator [Roseovarius sp. PS-C2]